MEKIPTAEEFWIAFQDSSSFTVPEAMIEFAKLHVEAALKGASATDLVSGRSYEHRTEYDKDSILNSYPLTNIK